MNIELEDNFVYDGCEDDLDAVISEYTKNTSYPETQDSDDDHKIIEDLINDRRKLSDKLENDKDYRRKYIKVQNDVLGKEDSYDVDSSDQDIKELKKIINNTYKHLNNPTEQNIGMNEEDDLIRLSDLEDSGDNEKKSDTKTGVYIQNVNSLTINIHL